MDKSRLDSWDTPWSKRLYAHWIGRLEVGLFLGGQCGPAWAAGLDQFQRPGTATYPGAGGVRGERGTA